MSKLAEPRHIAPDTPIQDDGDYNVAGIYYQDASQEAVDICLNTAINEPNLNGRSQWIWVRLPNGDLVLGFFPQGDTYLATEHLRSI